ncbi:MAG: ABC transporter substrate-binding protein [Ktedonobacteraceae bacterium]|nr:ABC transporter substrate-binding protein [Ktedonobacteraceae bacterium]
MVSSLRSRGLCLVGLVMIFALLLAACGSSPNPLGLVNPGVLTVGSDTTYPPQEFIDTATHKTVGFDVDVITEVAKRMHLQANVVTTGFTTIFDSLASKRFDVVISAVTINPDRQKKFDFVPYFNAGESLLVAKGNPLNLKTTADLCGKNVGVQDGTVEQTDLQTANKDCTSKGKPAINLTVLKDQTAVVELLANKRVVATYQDSPVTDYYLKQNLGMFEVGGAVVNAAQEGIVVRKGDSAMLNAVQQAFNAMKSDGTYTQFINKWGLTSGAISLVDRRTTVA